jgi:hypothetical protein
MLCSVLSFVLCKLSYCGAACFELFRIIHIGEQLWMFGELECQSGAYPIHRLPFPNSDGTICTGLLVIS